MNPMLQRHCAKFIYIVPDGLRELMSDISREVIRTQPEQIYTYIADYLDALMITRENARIAARMIDSISEIAETTVSILLRIGLTRPEADAIVAVIQTAFREYLEKKRLHREPFEEQSVVGEDVIPLTEEEAFTQKILGQLNISLPKLQEMIIIIQTAWRKFKARQKCERQLLFGIVDWRIAARSAIALYRKTGVTKYEANRAATLIKAAYKGYYTRRVMRRLLCKGLEEEEILGEIISEAPPDTETAIQSYLESEVGEDETPMEYMPIDVIYELEEPISADQSPHPIEDIADATGAVPSTPKITKSTPKQVASTPTAASAAAMHKEHEEDIMGPEGGEHREPMHEGEPADIVTEETDEHVPPNTENISSGEEDDGAPTTEEEDLPHDAAAVAPTDEAGEPAEPEPEATEKPAEAVEPTAEEEKPAADEPPPPDAAGGGDTDAGDSTQPDTANETADETGNETEDEEK